MTKPSARKPPLWRCPDCGRRFANRNQSHACGRQGLESHFEGKSPEVRELFDALLTLLRRCGPPYGPPGENPHRVSGADVLRRGVRP